MNKKPFIDLQSIIDAQDNPFVLIDEHYNIVCANKAYRNTYGVPDEEIVGRKCHQVSHLSDVPCHLNGEDCPHKQVFATNRPHEVMHVHYDRHGRPDRVQIKGSPVLGESGERYLGEAIFRLQQSNDLDCSEQGIMGKSPAFLAFLEQLTRAAETDASILLTGEIGVGKDLAAQYIHKSSPRRGMPLVHLACSNIRMEDFESELFGQEMSSSNGCAGRRFGRFESADEGILFIDEIADMPLAIQGRLLHSLQTGTYRRTGGTETLRANVRLVTCTARNLLAMVEQGRFRADLYYRIAGIKVDIPPLRDRKSDIPALADALLRRMEYPGGHRCTLSESALQKLLAYNFPGNIHELRNILQQAATRSSNGLITPELISLDTGTVYQQRRQQDTETVSIRDMEARHIADLLTRHRGHRRKVAEELGISERTLYRKLIRYDLGNIGREAPPPPDSR
jgi:transcriptional regulator with PAS, ATPase and Fis domain